MPATEKNRCIFLLLAYSNLNIFFHVSLEINDLCPPLSPSVALLTVSLSRWEMEGKLGKRHLWVLWPALIISAMTPIALIFTMHEWVPTKHGLSTIHIAIPIIILLIGTLIALFSFISSRRFFQLKKIFCFTNCIFLVITIAYSAKYLGTFRSTKDIVGKCLSCKDENYVLLSYARIVPSLVFYSGKNIRAFEENTRLKDIVPDKDKSIYVVMSLNDYQKKQDWIQKRKLHAVCQNNAHVMLKKEPNTDK